MAASQSRETRTASTCTADMARGTHTFKIANYSLHKGLGNGRFIRSATFAVGGYHWSIRYYPDGNWSVRHLDHVLVYLQLMSRKAEVRALLDFRLVDQATGQSVAMHPKPMPVQLFNTIDASKRASWGTFTLKKKSEVEASSYLQDDCLIIVCNVTVINKEPRVVDETAIKPECEVQMPPPDLSDNLGRLLEEQKGADVTFKVRDEVFLAHKIVLSMRSPVFDAELFGPVGENTRQCITVEDMHPDVFRALLHFVYTDLMPSTEDFSPDDSKEMIMHLLVAADRYAIERLKLICEGILCKSLDADNMATVLALADQYQCNNLKNACIAFISSSNKIDNEVASQDMLKNITMWMHGCRDKLVSCFCLL